METTTHTIVFQKKSFEGERVKEGGEDLPKEDRLAKAYYQPLVLKVEGKIRFDGRKFFFFRMKWFLGKKEKENGSVQTRWDLATEDGRGIKRNAGLELFSNYPSRDS